MAKPKLRIGLIGSGFMGKAHAFGYTTAARVFDLPYEPELHTLADINNEVAAKAAAALGFAQATSDWRSLVGDPDINVVNIAAPHALHKEMGWRRSPLESMFIAKSLWCPSPSTLAKWPRPLRRPTWRRRSASTISAIRYSVSRAK
jgi:hypothetical protein